MILLILHPTLGRLENLPPSGHILSPAGCILLPSGLEPAALRPSGSNMQPLGDRMFGPWAVNFPVSRGRGCRIITILKR